MKVIKQSGKPFKSGLKINTVKSHTLNPNTGKPAFTFYEDESCVDAHICYEVKWGIEWLSDLLASL